MKNDEWVELTKIINEYMNEKKWHIIEALNFMKGVLVKTAVYHNVSEEKFILQCEDMKEIFCEIMLAKNIKEMIGIDI